MRYRIVSTGQEILATADFMEVHHTGDYQAIVEAEASHAPTKITRLAFRNRFTPAEKVALYTAAASSVQLRVYLDDLSAATYVDLRRADTIAGVQALEAATIIEPGRAAEILGAPITDEEVYVG